MVKGLLQGPSPRVSSQRASSQRASPPRTSPQSLLQGPPPRTSLKCLSQMPFQGHPPKGPFSDLLRPPQGYEALTHNTPLIHTSFTCSKWNMGEICGLTFHLLHVQTSQIFLLKSLHAQKMLFLSSPSTCRTSGASKNRDWSCQNGVIEL